LSDHPPEQACLGFAATHDLSFDLSEPEAQRSKRLDFALDTQQTKLLNSSVTS
jgi:hypothetical protein